MAVEKRDEKWDGAFLKRSVWTGNWDKLLALLRVLP